MMNKRIEELAKQAHILANGKYSTSAEINFCDIYNQIFTELIVKECLCIARQEHKSALEFDWDNDDTAQTIRDSISEHFGVKE